MPNYVLNAKKKLKGIDNIHKPTPNIKFYLIFVITATLGAFIDLASKSYVFANYNFYKPMPIIKNIFSFVCVENEGIVWGIKLFDGKLTALNIILPFIAAAIMAYMLFTLRYKNTIIYISFGLIMSGTIGNLYDRILFGSVRDFIKLDFISWPVFNPADAFICVGVTLFALFTIFCKEEDEEVIETLTIQKDNEEDES